jgi:steroid 5-alpha reductase family enzyme
MGWFVALFVLVALGQAVAMVGAWLIQRQTSNAGWVDVVWTLATGAGGVICALAPVAGPSTPRQWVVAALAAAWSVRLAAHIAVRTAGRPEDVRYARFREEWGPAFQHRMLAFLMIQAAAAALLTLSILVAARNPAPGLRPADWLGIAILAIAIAGEGLADGQMRRFRDTAEKGAVCDTGLWGWSRHPNYFFEWLGWCAYPVMAINFDWSAGWLALTGPAFMFWLLRYVSGVPPLEEAMLRSRGARFVDYQRRVSAFFPLPPRHQERTLS